MDPMVKYDPIIGDDLPFNTLAYRDIPNGFGFSVLNFPVDKPLTLALKDKLVDYCNKYFRNYEINGTTIADWQVDLQLALTENVDTFEKMMEVYDDDIAKPLQSRTIKRTYDIIDDTAINGTDKNTGTVKSNIANMDYDLPIDNPTGQPVAKSNSDGTTTNDLTTATNGTTKYTHKGTETEDWSDVGVAPNYELLNGFLDNNRTYYNVFTSFFKDCFTLGEYYYGRS